jgi:CubicO group peptidase (beta-lactamase class C family)
VSDGSDFGREAASLAEEIPSLLEAHQVPGLAVGICDASGVRWSAGFGVVGRASKQPVGTSTVFSIQSASKMYTATAVLLAVQQGLVDLDEPITSYLPEFTVNSRFEAQPERRMTLRHLLSHTAGFTHEAPIGGNYEVGRGSFETHCRSISDTWLRFPVGQHFDYSNLGIDLAGYVLQRRSGLPFHEFVRRELLAPLGLNRTTFDHRVVGRERDRALGHEGRRRRVPVRVPMVAAGAVYTSVDEALRYLQFHLRGGEDLLDPGLLEEMYRIPNPAPGQELGFGLGLIVARWENGTFTYGHGGGGFGFACELNWSPERGVGVVVLTNYSGHALHVDLSHRIFGQVARGEARPDPALPPAVPASAEKIDRMAGTYGGSRGGALKVTREGSGVALVVGEERYPARVIGADQIVLEGGPQATGRQLFALKARERFRFLPGADGRPRYMQSMDDGYVRYRNERLPGGEATPLDPEWTGKYRIKVSGAVGATAELRNDDDGPVIAFGDEAAPLGRHRPGVYFSADGEALDLTKTPPTYANIKLFKD